MWCKYLMFKQYNWMISAKLIFFQEMIVIIEL